MADDWARPVVHWDIQARDPERIRDFYAQMFNWEIAGAPPIMSIAAGVGGPPPEALSGHILKSERSGVTLYVQVLDLRASMDRATELGGRVLNQPIDVPDGPTIAGIADPEGNPIVLVQQ